MNRTTSLKRYEFFDVEVLTDDISASLGTYPTCASADSGALVFGDRSGCVIISDQSFRISGTKHQIFRGEIKYIISGRGDASSHNRQYIVALGDDAVHTEQDPSAIYFLKIYSLNNMARAMHVINCHIYMKGIQVTSLAVLSDGCQIAVGYSTGAVVLFTGNFLKESSSQMRSTSRSTQVTLQSSHRYPVASLFFAEVASKQATQRHIRLFAVMDTTVTNQQSKPNTAEASDDSSISGILLFDTSITMTGSKHFSISMNASRHAVKVLDDRGASPNSSSFSRDTNELIVVRADAVYSYSFEDRGGALAISGEKLCSCAAGRYVFIASVEDRNSSSVVYGGAGTIEGKETSSKSRRPVLNIYDLKNRIICGTAKKYQLPISERIALLLSDNSGTVYVLSTGGQLIRFTEKDTARKMDILLVHTKPPLFSLAITIAAEEQMEASEIMQLYKRYGDYLYDDEDFDGAVTQYCYTAGFIPSSAIITKFLDPYRIRNLITYLEKLHSRGLAGSDHLTLLLICYSKGKDSVSINKLLDQVMSIPNTDSSSSSPSSSGPVINHRNSRSSIIDPLQVISLLQNAGCIDEAIKVAVAFKEHDCYIRLQLSSKSPPDYDAALSYLAYVPFVSATSSVLFLIKKYGRELVKMRPTLFTSLLIKFCIGDYVTLLPYEHILSIKQSLTAAISPAEVKSEAPMLSGDRMKLLALMSINSDSSFIPSERLPVGEVLHLFDYSESACLLKLLESVAESSVMGRVMPPKVSSTLLELYLQKHSNIAQHIIALRKEATFNDNRVQQQETLLLQIGINIMQILDGGRAHYDPAHALLLCYSFEFQPGQRFLLEKQSCIDLLMRMLMEERDVQAIFKVLRRQPGRDPDLYVQVLTFFVEQSIALSISSSDEASDAPFTRDRSDSELYESCESSRWTHAVADLVDLIEKDGILSVAQVLSILSLNPRLPISVASDFIINHLKTLAEGIAAVEDKVVSVMNDLETISYTKNALNQMSTGNKSNSRRDQDRRPSAGTMFTMGSFDEDDELFDGNSGDHKQVLRDEYWHNLRQSMVECSLDHEAFYKRLEHSADGFEVVVEHFGRSIVS